MPHHTIFLTIDSKILVPFLFHCAVLSQNIYRLKSDSLNLSAEKGEEEDGWMPWHRLINFDARPRDDYLPKNETESESCR